MHDIYTTTFDIFLPTWMENDLLRDLNKPEERSLTGNAEA